MDMNLTRVEVKTCSTWHKFLGWQRNGGRGSLTFSDWNGPHGRGDTLYMTNEVKIKMLHFLQHSPPKKQKCIGETKWFKCFTFIGWITKLSIAYRKGYTFCKHSFFFVYFFWVGGGGGPLLFITEIKGHSLFMTMLMGVTNFMTAILISPHLPTAG